MNIRQKKDILHRLKIISGHIDKVSSMVDSEQDCMNILHQIRAVKAALQSCDDVILEQHLRACVRESLKNKNTEEKIIEELITSYKASHS